MPELSSALIVFSDLDGSLLDHDTYSWEPAIPWLVRLQQHQVPVIIASSKTAAEVVPLQQTMGLHEYPFIAENGALVTLPRSWSSHPDYPRKIFNADYSFICQVLGTLHKEYQFDFQGFSDMDDEKVSDITGLGIEESALARQREASEPLQWFDDDIALGRFRQSLEKYGLSLTQGGRFYHVMGRGVSKGNAVNWLTSQYVQQRKTEMLTIGLGDSPNDISMLESTDYAVIIKNKSHLHVTMSQKNHTKIYLTQQSGPSGWSEGLNHFLADGESII
ncbi:mannosyl-3-phosphoglycerate phosphatase [Prodigiosinella confusarubida]|uniref:Mannosyl-3-phosphoglycerate phosphatase n=1 Tax=Serratia sp. (strain ATCC 39006) TaxID=104623 RepID=A0A2I5TKL2_SERS3|nr:mannosyl-3-phosphoglycerate phosphatase-related protein [Serratia sp. ATCC 39006]AUH00741.1 mannosyl-3-phosphoglycerate phosphatase [Serratia sp. ATCC 39006]AUH05062.1 mannosyl-3-phosphoglycerate phosphatase [Serratia sp. ATCC 39006]